jgi:hypothetical protein
MSKVYRNVESATRRDSSVGDYFQVENFMPMSMLKTLLIVTGLLMPLLASAEITALSQDELQKAPLVVTGVVTSLSEVQSIQGDCITRHDVSIIIKTTSGGTSTVRGYYDVWTCWKGHDGLPAPQQPPGHYGVWGIRSIRVGDKVKVYAAKDGRIFDPNGIQQIVHSGS